MVRQGAASDCGLTHGPKEPQVALSLFAHLFFRVFPLAWRPVPTRHVFSPRHREPVREVGTLSFCSLPPCGTGGLGHVSAKERSGPPHFYGAVFPRKQAHDSRTPRGGMGSLFLVAIGLETGASPPHPRGRPRSSSLVHGLRMPSPLPFGSETATAQVMHFWLFLGRWGASYMP